MIREETEDVFAKHCVTLFGVSLQGKNVGSTSFGWYSITYTEGIPTIIEMYEVTHSIRSRGRLYRRQTHCSSTRQEEEDARWLQSPIRKLRFHSGHAH